MMKMKSSDEEYEEFKIARQYWRDEDYDKALSLTKELVKAYPETGINWVLYGVIYSDLGDLVSAEEQFRIATQLAPRTERFSMGLFHSLWNQDKNLKRLKRKLDIQNFETPRNIDYFGKILEWNIRRCGCKMFDLMEV